MERIVRNRSATLRKTFYVDGSPADPTGTPTVAVARADGSAVSTGAVTNETEAGTWSVTIAATANTLLDTLTVTWTGIVAGVAQQYVDVVEVCGDVLFSLAEAQAIRLGGVSETLGSRFTVAQIAEMRTTVEQSIEDAYGAALVPRYEHETLDGTGRAVLPLRWPLVRAVRSATVGGSALDVSGIDVGKLFVSYSSGWTAGYGNVVVGYEHGLDRPPEILRRMGLLLAKRWLIEGPVDDRATSVATEDGTFALSTPGRGGSIFGLPDLDRAINASPYRIGIA